MNFFINDGLITFVRNAHWIWKPASDFLCGKKIISTLSFRLHVLHFVHILALSLFYLKGVSPIPSSSGMLDGSTTPGLSIPARIADIVCISFCHWLGTGQLSQTGTLVADG